MTRNTEVIEYMVFLLFISGKDKKPAENKTTDKGKSLKCYLKER